MGGCFSTDDNANPDAVTASQNSEINQQIRKWQQQDARRATLLLLGTGESGKSTFFRQLKLMALKINHGTLSTDELLAYRPLIFKQIITEMSLLIHQAKNMGFPLDSAKNVAYADWFLNVPSDGSLWNDDCVTVVNLLWNDSAIKKTFNSRGQTFHLSDSASYFFDNIGRFTSNVIPSKQDIIRVRIRTTGIDEAPMKWEAFEFSLVDVGGQRTERKRWMHLFENKISALIYCVSLSDYDQMLREDHGTNRMKESLELFRELMTSYSYFQNVNVFLLMNKYDLFKEKIQVKDPRDYGFVDYQGGCNEENAKAYFRSLFEKQFPKTNRGKLFISDFTAVSSENVRFVFHQIRNEMMQRMINILGDFQLQEQVSTLSLSPQNQTSSSNNNSKSNGNGGVGSSSSSGNNNNGNKTNQSDSVLNNSSSAASNPRDTIQ